MPIEIKLALLPANSLKSSKREGVGKVFSHNRTESRGDKRIGMEIWGCNSQGAKSCYTFIYQTKSWSLGTLLGTVKNLHPAWNNSKFIKKNIKIILVAP